MFYIPLNVYQNSWRHAIMLKDEEMPLYMDRHYGEGATKAAVADAHDKNLAIQEKYPVKFYTYWFDEPRCTAFCLIESPDRETIQRAHN